MHLLGHLICQRLAVLSALLAEQQIEAHALHRAGAAAAHAQQTSGAAAVHCAHGFYTGNCEHGLHGLIGHFIGLLALGALGQSEGGAYLIAAHGGHELHAHAGRLPHRQDQQQRRQTQRQHLVPQAEAQRPGIAVHHALEPGMTLFTGGFQQGAAEGGHQRKGHQQTGHQRIGNGQAHIGEQLAGDSLGKHDGQEHADGGERGSRDGARHLLGTPHRRLGRRGALAAHSVDIFDDYDRVIHQHTHTQSQTAQGDHVQGYAGEVHEHHRKHQADGNAQRHHQSGLEVLQEDRQHDDRQHAAPRQVGQHAAHRHLDVVALVHQRGDAQTGVFYLQFLNGPVGLLGHLAGGGSGALLDGQYHRAVAVHPGITLGAVVGHGDIRHVLQADIAHAVDVHQQGILHALLIREGIAHSQDVGVVSFLDIACGHGEVLSHHQTAHHVLGEQLGEVCLLHGLLTGVLKLLLGLFHLLLGLGQRLLRRRQLSLTAAKTRRRTELSALQLLVSLLGLFQTLLGSLLHHLGRHQLGFQVGQLGIDLGQSLVHLLLQLGLLLRQRLALGSQLGALGGQLVFLGQQLLLARRQIRQSGHPLVDQCLHRVLQLLSGQHGRQIAQCGILRQAHGQQLVDARCRSVDLCNTIVHLGQTRIHLGQTVGDLLCAVLIALFLCFQSGLAGGEGGLLAGQRLGLGNGGIQLSAALRQLAGGLGLFILQGGLPVFQLGTAVLHLLAGIVQLLLRLGQLVIHTGQKLSVHLVDLFLVQGHLQGLFHHAGTAHTGHAVQPFKTGDHIGIHKLGELVDVHILHIHAGDHHREHIRRKLHQHGILGRLRQCALDLIQRGGQSHHGAVHIGVLLKFQSHHAHVLAGGAGHVFHTAHGAQPRLQRCGYCRLHPLRAGTGIAGHHHHIGQFHGGQEIRGHAGKADHAQHDHHDHRHHHGKRLFHAIFGHSCLLLNAFCRMKPPCKNTQRHKADRPVGRLT